MYHTIVTVSLDKRYNNLAQALASGSTFSREERLTKATGCTDWFLKWLTTSREEFRQESMISVMSLFTTSKRGFPGDNKENLEMGMRHFIDAVSIGHGIDHQFSIMDRKELPSDILNMLMVEEGTRGSSYLDQWQQEKEAGSGNDNSEYVLVVHSSHVWVKLCQTLLHTFRTAMQFPKLIERYDSLPSEGISTRYMYRVIDEIRLGRFEYSKEGEATANYSFDDWRGSPVIKFTGSSFKRTTVIHRDAITRLNKMFGSPQHGDDDKLHKYARAMKFIYMSLNKKDRDYFPYSGGGWLYLSTPMCSYGDGEYYIRRRMMSDYYADFADVNCSDDARDFTMRSGGDPTRAVDRMMSKVQKINFKKDNIEQRYYEIVAEFIAESLRPLFEKNAKGLEYCCYLDNHFKNVSMFRQLLATETNKQVLVDWDKDSYKVDSVVSLDEEF